jgi:DNA-binding LytR/AlgR family response regulator
MMEHNGLAPIRTLIVDDEALARKRLKRLLDEIDGVELVGEAEDGLQALQVIDQLSPDLVLLDIQMPGLTGFEVVEALDDPPQVIFVTAYDEYAIRAFEVHALDYLLKPFGRARLVRAIRRAREALTEDRSLEAKLGSLLEGLAAQGRYLNRMAVRDRDRIRVLDVHEIDYIAIDADQIIAHVGESAFSIRRTMSELETRLDPLSFFRAHRSAIVNLDRVQEIIPWFKGSHKLRLTTGADVDLSRARTRVLRRILGW